MPLLEQVIETQARTCDRLHSSDTTTTREATRKVASDFLGRLESVFEKTVEYPLIPHNSKHSPMYALCFAAGNPKGAPTAVKIASHLVRGYTNLRK